MIQTPSLSLRYEHIDLKRHALKGTVAQDFRLRRKKKLYLDPIGNEEKKVSQHFFAFAKIFVKNVSADHADTTKKRGHRRQTLKASHRL